MSQARFAAEITQGVGTWLAKGGFTKRKPGIYTRVLAPGVLGWVGLTEVGEPVAGRVRINPIVGVRHQQLEEKWARLMGTKPHAFLQPTLSTNAGFLGPRHQYKDWEFEHGHNNTAIVARLARFILDTGLTFMKETTSLEKILGRSELMVPDSRLFRIPIIHWLTGDEERVRVVLRRDLESTRLRRDDAIQDFRVFAKKLMGKLE